jgi:hypothetical protein
MEGGRKRFRTYAGAIAYVAGELSGIKGLRILKRHLLFFFLNQKLIPAGQGI